MRGTKQWIRFARRARLVVFGLLATAVAVAPAERVEAQDAAEATITFEAALPADVGPGGLTVDGVQTSWDFSALTQTIPADVEVLVEFELVAPGPADSFELSCGPGATAARTFRVGQWRVTADADAQADCVFERLGEPPETLDVVINLVGPADAAGVPVSVLWWSAWQSLAESVVLFAGESTTFTVPALEESAEFIRLVEGSWETAISCEPDVDLYVNSNEFEFNADGLGGTTVVCTIELVPPASLTVDYTKVAPGIDRPFEVSMQGSAQSLVDGETARFDDVGLPLRITETLIPGTRLLSITCTDGVWSETVVPNDDWRFSSFWFTLDQAIAGSTVSCTSTSEPFDGDAEVTFIRTGPAGASTLAVTADGGSSTVSYQLDDQVTVVLPVDTRVAVSVTPPPGQVFDQVLCDGLAVSIAEGVGHFTMEPGPGQTDCFIATVAQDNPPVSVTLSATSSPGEPISEVIIVERVRGETRVEFVDDIVLERVLGVPDPSIGGLVADGVAFTVSSQSPWELGGVSCDRDSDVRISVDDPGLRQSRFGSVTIRFLSLEQGAQLHCELEMVRLASVPVQVELVPVGASNPADLVGAALLVDEFRSQTFGPDLMAEFELAIDREQGVIPEVNLAGYVVTSADCDYPGYFSWSFGSQGTGVFITVPSYAVPAAIACSFTVAPADGSQIVLRTVVDGVEGNGSFGFDLEIGWLGPSRPLSLTRVAQTDQVAVAVPSERIVIKPVTAPGWDLVATECTPSANAELVDGGVQIDLYRGASAECTFTNRLVNQDVGAPGDATCNGSTDIVDALVIAQFAAQIRTGASLCPLADATSEVLVTAADVDGSGTANIVDALLVAQCATGAANQEWCSS